MMSHVSFLSATTCGGVKLHDLHESKDGTRVHFSFQRMHVHDFDFYGMICCVLQVCGACISCGCWHVLLWK